MDKPFDGAITAFYETEAPAEIRRAVAGARGGPILGQSYPYDSQLKGKTYRETLRALQIQLVRLQAWVRASGARVAVLFEGRDAAGKGGAIERFHANLNPRTARIVALPKPTEREQGQWYFQRYVEQLPSAGEIVLFDRSWYNRAVVEHVFGFCTAEERRRFFLQLPDFEKMLVDDGIHLFKIWLTLGRAEQLNRMLSRENDPLKQWKLSAIDIEGLRRWDAYTAAITETLELTHEVRAPWTVIRADDKRRARIEAIRTVLLGIDFDGKNGAAIGWPDGAIVGGPALIHA
jgi:polyphosphate kinase 2